MAMMRSAYGWLKQHFTHSSPLASTLWPFDSHSEDDDDVSISIKRSLSAQQLSFRNLDVVSVSHKSCIVLKQL
jgi:hypothetical protein